MEKTEVTNDSSNKYYVTPVKSALLFDTMAPANTTAPVTHSFTTSLLSAPSHLDVSSAGQDTVAPCSLFLKGTAIVLFIHGKNL